MANKEAADLYKHRNDDGEWTDEAEGIEVRPRRSEVVSFRIPSEELDRIEDAAEKAGESVSQFIRAAIQMRLEGNTTPISWIPILDAMTGGSGFVVDLHDHRRSSIGEAPTSWVPDRPPVLVNVTEEDRSQG